MADHSSRAFVAVLVSAFALSTVLTAAGAVDVVSGRRLFQSITEFPPNCECERNSSTSPYRLTVSNITTVPGFAVTCFKVFTAGCNVTNNKCCDGNQGVMKVEFDVVPSCKSSVKRVTLNGQSYGAWEYNQALGTLRVTSLNRTSATADGTEICLYFPEKANCTGIDQLCPLGSGTCKYAIFNGDRDCCPVDIVSTVPAPPPPGFISIVPAFAAPPSPPPPPSPPSPSPPSPPPPSPAPPAPPPPVFPNCTCDRDPANSRISLSPIVTSESYNNSWTKSCFTVTNQALCLPGSRCCTFTLAKLELAVKPSCLGSLMYATAGGERATRVFQTRPYPAVKVNNLGRAFEDTDGLEVCVFLRPPCNTLEALSSNGDGTIAVGLFNVPNPTTSCCPIYNLAV